MLVQQPPVLQPDVEDGGGVGGDNEQLVVVGHRDMQVGVAGLKVGNGERGQFEGGVGQAEHGVVF